MQDEPVSLEAYVIYHIFEIDIDIVYSTLYAMTKN